MAINPLDILREHLLNVPARTTSDPIRGKGGFDNLLEHSLTQNQSLSADQARNLAALAKLEMMAGLISWDDERDRGPSIFQAFPPLPAVPRAPGVNAAQAAQARQKFSLMSENRPAPIRAARLIPAAEKTPQTSMEQIVDQAAQRYQIAPELIKAVIKAESSFNPKAVSPAGAQGLMQLMPATARELGVDDPFDAEQNVMGGTRYLRDLLRRYDGDLDQALAAYNWGMGNLARSNGRLPEETRTYQIRVKQFMAEFQHNAKA